MFGSIQILGREVLTLDSGQRPAVRLADELAALLNVNRSTLSMQAVAELPRLDSGKIDYARLSAAA